ncbi:phenazine biosynthesis protein PhzF family [Hyaloraphidium curvatum]|nr:phenazine biosynthesis protein PhzF family [Hyaloraphidium curvatum]
MSFAFAVVDAFAARPFAGNPAAIVPLSGPSWPGDEVLKKIAAEFNLSETAFLMPQSPGKHKLRWFTPAVEVSLCGHATLASAAHLFSVDASLQSIDFETLSGTLVARRKGDEVELDFPEDVPQAADEEAIWTGITAGLGVAREAVEWTGRGKDDVVVVLKEGYNLRDLKTNMTALAKIPGRGVIVTVRGPEGGPHFLSRFFGPNAGIPEDPATGSAHCTLACLWAPKLGADEMRGRQDSARTGEIGVRWDREKKRVFLTGKAWEVASGKMVWPEL